MNELDMSKPGFELFAEGDNMKYNSYEDVNVGHSVDDPLDLGVTQPEVAQPAQMSDKEMNFRALRDEAAKLKEEREYWKGQAEALSRQPSQSAELPKPPADAYSSFDWDDSRDVKKAFDQVRQDNERLRNEMRDNLAAIQTKNSHQDWNNMVTRHVPELTSKNPIFAEMIKNASNPYEAAYLLAELNSKASQASSQPDYRQENVNAQRVMANSKKPQTLASIGGHGTLSNSDYYSNMSDEDFMKIAGRNLANT